MTEWYTCTNCPPHGLTDHSLYGQKACLIEGCPCLHFSPKKPAA